MSLEAPKYEIKNLDHLGIVSGFCDEIDLVGHIDRAVASSPKRKVSVGQGIKALLLNGLGYTERTLYLSHLFFKDKPVSLLLGEGLEYKDLHDDCLGSCLDAVYEYGVSKLFMELSFSSLRHFDIPLLIKHLDSTSISVQGEGIEEAGVIKIRPGYNKQGQHDLNQLVLHIVTNNRGGIPLFMNVHDGNEVDKKGFMKVIGAYKEELNSQNKDGLDKNGLWVVDNALYTAENIKDLAKTLWLSRAGHGLKWVQTLYQSSSTKSWTGIGGETDYSYQLGKTDWGGIKQGVLVILSENKKRKDLKALEKRISKSRITEEKGLKQLKKQVFIKASQAKAASEKFSKKSKYYSLSKIKIIQQEHYKPGRRKKGEKPESYTYRIESELIIDDEKVKIAKNSAGKFVLVSNEINEKEWSKSVLQPNLFKRPVAELLVLYKNGQQKVERSFRFLKDPLFLLSHIFLKLPRRIIALCMVMCLSLLIYALAEWKLRKTMAEQEETLPNQLGKPVKNPSMRWIFQQFQGIHLLYVHIKGQVQMTIVGLDALHRKILELLGNSMLKYYTI